MGILNVLLLILVFGLAAIVAVPLLLFRLLHRRAGGPDRFRHGRSREGEVSVSGKDNTAPDGKIIGRDVGEYVDYEEVDENK